MLYTWANKTSQNSGSSLETLVPCPSNYNVNTSVENKIDIREVKHHVHVKRQTRVVPRDQVSPLLVVYILLFLHIN